MPILARFPYRRFELAFGAGLVLACCALIGVAREVKDLAAILSLLALELILPAAMGLVSSGLLAGDPALEIVLSAHRPAWQILAERLMILVGVAAGLGTVLLGLARLWNLPLPKDAGDQIFIWLSPVTFSLGLANAVALLRGHALDGVIAVIGVMGASLLALLAIPQMCAGTPNGEMCAWWLASPLMTLGGSSDPGWPLNRLAWLGLGLGLLAASFGLAQREEVLAHPGTGE